VVIAATDINAFHVIGALLAIWAVLVAALGIMRHDFPGSGATEKAVMAISTILVIGAVSSGIITSANAEHGGSGSEETEHNKAGEEGTESTTETPAPDTAPESDQEGSSESGQPAPEGEPVQTLELEAGPGSELAFDPSELEAKAGQVALVMSNPTPLPHNVAIEGPGGVSEEGPVVQTDGESEVEAEVEPGEYTYYCAVPGHREAGMEGTLTVTK
jgi:plastocyanin